MFREPIWTLYLTALTLLITGAGLLWYSVSVRRPEHWSSTVGLITAACGFGLACLPALAAIVLLIRDWVRRR